MIERFNLTVCPGASNMTTPSGESETLNILIEEDLEAVVDYSSDTSFFDHYESKTDTHVSDDESCHPPNPFPERDVAATQTALRPTLDVEPTLVTSNPLDEQQQQAIRENERAQRIAKTKSRLQRRRDYVFKPLTVDERLKRSDGQTLTTWGPGSETTTSEELATRETLCKRFVERCTITPSQYKARLMS